MLDLTGIRKLNADQLRAVIPAFLARNITDPAIRAANQQRIQDLLASRPDDEIKGALEWLIDLGDEHKLYPANPLLRDIARYWMRDLIVKSQVTGLSNLSAAMEAGPTIVVCNHRSYIDSTVIDAVVTWEGEETLANRIVSAAGPKVYATLFRRMASGALSTLPVPQSTRFSHTAQISPREMVRRVRQSLGVADAALNDGYCILIYPEGSRSRTGELQPFLKGVHRYLATPGLSVVPCALRGTEQMMAVDSTDLNCSTIRLDFGTPVDVAAAGGPRAALESVQSIVQSLLH